MNLKWFSSKIRLVALVESLGSDLYIDSVFIFKADDFKDAFEKAIKLGKNQEEEYINANNKRVCWRLKEIISLDLIKQEELDGVEVYSEPIEIQTDKREPFDVVYHPEKSEPTQTI